MISVESVGVARMSLQGIGAFSKLICLVNRASNTEDFDPFLLLLPILNAKHLNVNMAKTFGRACSERYKSGSFVVHENGCRSQWPDSHTLENVPNIYGSFSGI